MREEKIIVEPFQFISYLEVYAFKSIGQHGVVKIKGIVDGLLANEYLHMAEKDLWIKVILQNEDINAIFFQGIIKELCIREENGVHIMEFEARSGSYLLDCGEHIRSFQADEITYSQMIDACLQPYGNAFCNTENENDIQIQENVLQFQESDWKFIKRLAGKQNTVVFPNNCESGIKISFGFKEKSNTERLESTVYSIKKCKLGCEFIVVDREYHEIGDTVIFDNKKLVIYQVISHMRGNELYHEYYLRNKSEIGQPFSYNEKLQGASLKAVVTAVKRDMVQVTICNDENASGAGYRWYSYATVYSTPDGTGWYCMPEIGDMVRMVFPDVDENNAYIVSSVHMECGQDRTNPANKSFMNRQRKEILLTPDSIILRNNKGMLIELQDDKGIKMVSDKDIVLQAEKGITVSSNAHISMEAGNALSMKQGGALLSLSGTVKMSGGRINMN